MLLGTHGRKFTNLSKSFPQTYRKRSPWSPEKFFRKNQKSHERNNIFQRKIVFLDMKLWKHWASLWQRCWKRLAELLKKNYIKNWKNLGYYTSFTDNILPENDPLDAKDAVLTRRLNEFCQSQKVFASEKKMKFQFFDLKFFFLKTFLCEDKSRFLQTCRFFIARRPKK